MSRPSGWPSWSGKAPRHDRRRSDPAGRLGLDRQLQRLALTILHRPIEPLLGAIHRRRLAVLLEAVAVSRPQLTLTEIARRFGDRTDLRHRIKRADRLLGNRHLQRDSRDVYAALARRLPASLAAILLWLIGSAAERCGVHEPGCEQVWSAILW